MFFYKSNTNNKPKNYFGNDLYIYRKMSYYSIKVICKGKPSNDNEVYE